MNANSRNQLMQAHAKTPHSLSPAEIGALREEMRQAKNAMQRHLSARKLCSGTRENH